MRIFVTGGTGFIGSHLVTLLKKRNHQILLFTRGDTDRLSSMLSDFRPEAAIHLAWEGLPDYSWPLCVKNLELGLKIYEVLLQSDCRKIITTGTCWEYGETTSFVAAKTSLRLMGEMLAKEQSAAFIWARPFFVYGPGQRDTSLIPSVIHKIKNKEGPEIKNPNAVHDFIHVKDVSTALALLAEKEVISNLIDIGSGELHAVGDVAQCIVKIVQKEPVKIKPLEGVKGCKANIGPLKKLGWKAGYDLVSGIQEMVLQ